MISLEPKKHFQNHEQIKKELSTVVSSENFKIALSYALSEYVMQVAPSQEKLVGVRQFISILLNLPMKEELIPAFPNKTLQYNPPVKETPP